MAQRRMFSKSITNSSQFLMMPQSSQNLYFHLGMNADDDGFCEHFTIMRMTESKPDDLKVLQAKNFISVFDDRVLVITDWKENNYLRSDRYTPSKYLEIYKKEILALSQGKDTCGIPQVDQLATQVRLGKVRLGKVTDTAQSAEDGFSQFWEEYPRKQGKAPAYASWKKLKPSEGLRAQISAAIAEHKLSDQWKKNGGQFIPHAATWLNQKRWEDEVKITRQKSNVFVLGSDEECLAELKKLKSNSNYEL